MLDPAEVAEDLLLRFLANGAGVEEDQVRLLDIGRRPMVLVLACVALLAVPATAAAQVGIGARVSWVHSDTDADTTAYTWAGEEVADGRFFVTFSKTF